MANQENGAQAPMQSPDLTILTERVAELTSDGAIPTDSFFNCAVEGQADLIYHGQRWLLGLNDAKYQTYVTHLREATVPHIENNPELGSDAVFMGEIPRSARTIAQFSYSRQSPVGMNASDVFFAAGRRLALLASHGSVLPTAESFSLSRVMFNRSTARILFLPPLAFSPASHELRNRLVGQVQKELASRYEQFGGAALLHTFQEGLETGAT